MAQENVIADNFILQTKFVSQEPFKPLKEARDAFEKDYLVRLLGLSEGNVSRASKLAGKHRADFYDLLKKHDLKLEEFKRSR